MEVGLQPAAARGVRVDHGAYPTDPAAGAAMSLQKMAEKIREGRLDPAVRGWAGDVLIAAGRPQGVRRQAQAILDALRKATVYTPDPVGAEYISSAAATLCLRPGLCVRARDCDDGCVAFASAVMSIGISARIVKQTFGAGEQEHVLIEVQDENGAWLPADPSTEMPVGRKAPATREERVDPMSVYDAAVVGVAAARPPDYVGVGAIAKTRRVVERLPDGGWREYRYGQWWYFSPKTGRWTAAGLTVSEGTKHGLGVSEGTKSGQRGVVPGPMRPPRASALTVSEGTKHPLRALGMGVKVAWADLVEAEIMRVDALWASVRADVERCQAAGQIPDDEVRAFFLQYNAWAIFRDAHRDLSNWQFGLGGILDQVETYERYVYQWQLKFQGRCALSTPIVKPIPESQKPILPPLGTPETESTLRTLAVSAAAIAGAGLLAYLVFEGVQIYKTESAFRRRA